jgi:hypothetical protein
MQAGHLPPSPSQYLRRIEVLAGFLEDFRDHPPLTSHAEAMRLEFARDRASLFEVLGQDHLYLRIIRNKITSKTISYCQQLFSCL